MRHPIGRTTLFVSTLAVLTAAVFSTGYSQVGRGSSEEINFAYPVYSLTEEDDFPALATDHQEDKLLVWIAYKGESERLMGKIWRAGEWSPPFHVVPGTGNYFQPIAVSTDNGHLWVFWSAQDKRGQWDLYTRKYYEGSWSRIMRLTEDGGSDIFPDAASGGSRIVLVWQGFSAGNADIYMMVLPTEHLPDRRPQRVAVTTHSASDWEPAVVMDSRGIVTVVWDSYRDGMYNLFLRQWKDGQLTAVIRVTGDSTFDAHADAAVDRHDNVWIAWDRGTENWGRDDEINRFRDGSGGLHATRKLGLRYFNGVDFYDSPGPLPTTHAEDGVEFSELPHLSFDGKGSLHLLYRGWERRKPTEIYHIYHSVNSGGSWSDPVKVPGSAGRNTQHVATTLDGAGNLWAAWSTDGRGIAAQEGQKNPLRNYDIRAQRVAAAVPSDKPLSGSRITVSSAAPFQVSLPARPQRELKGKTYKLYFGEFHRHTDIRGHGGVDGSVLDSYRYAIDPAAMDFFATTDHIVVARNWYDGLREYQWWYTRKIASLFSVPGRFVPFAAYERSMGAGHGHKNVVYQDFDGPAIWADRTDRDWWLKNEPFVLWDNVKNNTGIAIPHTTGQANWWEFHDPVAEPLMEIYQGRRISYEYEGAPDPKRGVNTKGSRRMYRNGNAGMAWTALAKGYRIGFIASTDHRATHISFASVWAEDLSRQAIFEALLNRRTYAATDNIVLWFTANDEPMGSDFISPANQVTLKAEITGTDVIEKIDIIRNNTFLYSTEPGTREVDFSYLDTDITPGETYYYYLRLIQKDPDGTDVKEMAWSSPIWVTLSR